MDRVARGTPAVALPAPAARHGWPAAALRGRNAYYRLRDIQRRHFNAMAHKCGLGADMEDVVEEVLAQPDPVLDGLPAGFPEDVFATIAAGMRASARRLHNENRTTGPT